MIYDFIKLPIMNFSSLIGRDEFSNIVSHIDPDAHFAFALTCRAACKQLK